MKGNKGRKGKNESSTAKMKENEAPKGKVWKRKKL